MTMLQLMEKFATVIFRNIINRSSILLQFSFTFSLILNYLFDLILIFFLCIHLSMDPNQHNSWSNFMQNGGSLPFILNQQSNLYFENSPIISNSHHNQNFKTHILSQFQEKTHTLEITHIIHHFIHININNLHLNQLTQLCLIGLK